ncbi:Ribose import ATP-binding protein RbsA [Phycisphaerales bacterium]|nr:Ribose import ATP-binding protein RbsA [Phycisphaerales bacterium]
MTAPATDEILLRAEHVSKRFGITQALDNVSVSFLRGEIHALMGENGAGKSTLGKTIAGLHKPDAGTIVVDGRTLVPGNLDDAFDAGIRIVHQELAQCPNLTVAENLCLHDLPRTRFGFVDFRTMRDRAARLVHVLEPGIDVEAPLGALSPGHRQICQIAAALDNGAGHGAQPPGPTRAKVIVFDEPTSSLSVAETDRLLDIIRRLARERISIIYVSHRMGEIFAVCDRVTVLRDGKYVATSRVNEIDEPALVEQMIGRRLATPTARLRAAAPPTGPEAESAALRALGDSANHPGPGPVRLSVSNLSSPRRLKSISLEVRAGEIVGMGGLVGSGRSELLDAIFGLDPNARGIVLAAGVTLAGAAAPGKHRGPHVSIAAGVGYVPEDRRRQGLFFDLGVGENMLVPFMDRLAAALGFRRAGVERKVIADKFATYQIKAASPRSLPGELSGGNQQKLLIARWMDKDTKVLLLDEPTRGIDVGTKAEVYKLIHAAADQGAAVLLVSSEMPELLALSDRVLVMCDGRISGELAGAEMTQANILRLATIHHPARAKQPA